MTALLAEARALAAGYHEAHGRDDQARMIRAGGGDDFPEVQVALLAARAARPRIDLYRRALDNYADNGFWAGEFPEAALAFHDAGEIARAALAGREMYELHRD